MPKHEMSLVFESIVNRGKWLGRPVNIKEANKPGAVLPYMGYIDMCGPKRYGFSAVLVVNRLSFWPFW